MPPPLQQLPPSAASPQVMPTRSPPAVRRLASILLGVAAVSFIGMLVVVAPMPLQSPSPSQTAFGLISTRHYRPKGSGGDMITDDDGADGSGRVRGGREGPTAPAAKQQSPRHQRGESKFRLPSIADINGLEFRLDPMAGRGASSSSGGAQPISGWVFDLLRTSASGDDDDDEDEWRVVLSNPFYSEPNWWRRYAVVSSPDVASAGGGGGGGRGEGTVGSQCAAYLRDEHGGSAAHGEPAAFPHVSASLKTIDGAATAGGQWIFDGSGGAGGGGAALLDGGRGLKRVVGEGGRAGGDGQSPAAAASSAESIHSVHAFAHRVGPDYFEGSMSVTLDDDDDDGSGDGDGGTTRLAPLTFLFDASTCTYWGRRGATGVGRRGGGGAEEDMPARKERRQGDADRHGNGGGDAHHHTARPLPLPIGFTSFLMVHHLYTRHEALREDKEHAHYNYRPLRRLAWSGRGFGWKAEGEGYSPASAASFPLVYDSLQEVWAFPHHYYDSDGQQHQQQGDQLRSGAKRKSDEGLVVPQTRLVFGLPSVFTGGQHAEGGLASKGSAGFWLATRRDQTNLKYTSTSSSSSSPRQHFPPSPAGGYSTDPFFKDYYLSYKGLKKEHARAVQGHYRRRSSTDGGTADDNNMVAARGDGRWRRVTSGYAALTTMDWLGRLDYDAEYSFMVATNSSSSGGHVGGGGGGGTRRGALFASADAASRLACREEVGARYEHPLSSQQQQQQSAPREGSRSSALNDPAARVTCLREKLRNKIIYFIGDSHMRIFFYGFLTRLGVPYPLNKVWRGDRTDRIESHNVTVHFIASYFLNLTRPAAIRMLRESVLYADDAGAREGGDGSDRGARRPTAADVIIVANVGQHHSAHCWPLRKHSAFAREAMLGLVYGVAEATSGADGGTIRLPASVAARHGFVSPFVGGGPLSSSTLPTISEGRPKKRRGVYWLGVPAQPINQHLYMPKSRGGQGRADCRNNLRHWLFNSEQRALWEEVTLSSSSSSSPLPFIDAFGYSLGMAHTSLDGAHYFGWVRDAWLDALIEGVY